MILYVILCLLASLFLEEEGEEMPYPVYVSVSSWDAMHLRCRCRGH